MMAALELLLVDHIANKLWLHLAKKASLIVGRLCYLRGTPTSFGGRRGKDIFTSFRRG